MDELFDTLFISFFATHSEIDGSNLDERAVVMAEGNKTKGMLIPTIIPYTLMAVSSDKPYKTRKTGINMASTLCIAESNIRVRETGIAITGLFEVF